MSNIQAANQTSYGNTATAARWLETTGSDQQEVWPHLRQDEEPSVPERVTECSCTEAAWLLERLPEVYCSEPWVEAILVPIDRLGQRWEFRYGLYPPGQEETAMRSCPECGRVCPPNGVSSTCYDCEVERTEEAFRKQDRDFPDLAKELLHLRPRSISYRQFMEDGDDWEIVATMSDDLEDNQETATNWAGKTRESCETARERFRRHRGGRIVLLPESYKALKEEIKHYKEKLKEAKENGEGKTKEKDMIMLRASPKRRFETRRGSRARRARRSPDSCPVNSPSTFRQPLSTESPP